MTTMTRFIRPAIALAMGLSLALAAGPHSASAKVDAGTLYNHSALDFDQLQYFIERDKDISSSSTRKKTMTILDEYDQVHNREQARADETLSTKDKSGTWRTKHRVLEIVMLNNQTYSRTGPNQSWQVKKGFGFKDTVWDDTWVRAAPQLPPVNPKDVTLAGQGGGQSHLHIHTVIRKHTVTFDVWVTTGSQPVIVRLVDQSTTTTAGKTQQDSLDGRYSDFNKPITITAPPGTGGQGT
jgi:hypothetical protein